MSAMVEVRNVAKTYERGKQKVPVLNGLSLSIAKGDFVALMGPSGSGKTTLLNLIGGLDQPSSGEISVGGTRIDQLSSGALAKWRAANVGFVFQFYNLMPVLTAQKNVELPLLLTNLSAAQRRQNAAVALKLVGLDDRALQAGTDVLQPLVHDIGRDQPALPLHRLGHGGRPRRLARLQRSRPDLHDRPRVAHFPCGQKAGPAPGARARVRPGPGLQDTR
jgi:ABC-type glutathione transport system ATPase component